MPVWVLRYQLLSMLWCYLVKATVAYTNYLSTGYINTGCEVFKRIHFNSEMETFRGQWLLVNTFVHEKNSPKNVHENSPKKRNSCGKKCPLEFTKSVHENTSFLSTQICPLCPREYCNFCPPFTTGIPNFFLLSWHHWWTKCISCQMRSYIFKQENA